MSSYLRDKGEITGKTLEARIYISLLTVFPDCEKTITAVTDCKNGDNIEKISLKVPYDGIYGAFARTVNANPIDGKYALYSVDHEKSTHREIRR